MKYEFSSPQMPVLSTAQVGRDPISCNLNAVVQNISLDNSFAGPWGVAYDPASRTIYVSDANSSSISVINATTNTLVNTIPSILSANDIVYDSSDNEMYVSANSAIYIINAKTNQLITSIGNVNLVNLMTYDSANGDVYVGTFQALVYVISGTNVIANITVGNNAQSVAYDPLNNEIYVTATDSATVQVINPLTNAVIQNISGVGYPDAVIFDPTNGLVYANSLDGQLSIINNSVVVKTITIRLGQSGFSQYGMAYDPLNRELYLASGGPSGTNFVLALNTSTNSLVNNITGVEPSGGPNLAYDSSNGDIYVANYNAETVGVISTGCFVTFAETGLPAGSNWSLTFGGAMRTLTNSSTVFVSSAGNSSWNISSPLLISGNTRYAVFPSSGMLAVSSNFTMTLNFVKQYEVSFASSSASEGTTSPTGSLWENASSTIPISASSNPGFVFSSWSSTNSSVTFANATKSSTTATINGPATIRASFVPGSKSTTSSSLLNSLFGINRLYLAAVVVAVVVIALAVLFLRRKKKPSTVVVGPS